MFYNENKIICENKNIQDARIYLTYITGKVLKKAADLLGIKMPEDKSIQDARVYLTYATNLILKNGAQLLGINMPEKM